MTPVDRPVDPTAPGRPRVGVLAVQGGVAEHLRALGATGATAVPVRRPHELEALDGLVLPGGESTTMDRLLRVFELAEPLREVIGAGLPTFGTCAGMVLLADRIVDGVAGQRTLGGLDVTVRRNAFGRQLDSRDQQLDVRGLAEPLDAVFIRAPWVEDAGPLVEVLAEVEGHPVMVRQGHLLATAFHPELTSDVRVHQLFLDLVEQTRSGAG